LPVKMELSLSQLIGVVLTIIGLCFILYFFVLLNSRLSMYDFNRPIYGWTEIYEAIPLGTAWIWGIIIVFLGLIFNIWGLAKKGQASPPPPP
jgi:hypothetical protein